MALLPGSAGVFIDRAWPVRSPFGAPRSTGPHKGVDLGCPVGTPVHAGVGGEVYRVDVDGVGRGVHNGHAVLFRGAGFRWAYLHLSEAEVLVGQKVVAGQRIGLSGNTGDSTGPHLHLQATRENTESDVVDPLLLVPLVGAPGSKTFPLLSRGATGDEVRWLQTRLVAAGHALKIDGGFGPITDAALRSFQSAKKLPVTGSTDIATWYALGG